MKLSSVSLIIAALAAIAGSTVAAPGPLHARALEDVNSFSERDVDVYSRESGLEVDHLFTRQSPETADKAAEEAVRAAKAHEQAVKAAKAHELAAPACAEAAEKAGQVYLETGNLHFRNEHSNMLSFNTHHILKAIDHRKAAADILAGNANESQMSKHKHSRSMVNANNSRRAAVASSQASDEALRQAWEDRIAREHERAIRARQDATRRGHGA